MFLVAALVLGVGVWTAWTSLLGRVISPAWAGGLAAAASLALLAWGGRRPRLRLRLRLRASEWFFLGLTGLVSWLYAVGGFQLSAPLDFFTFGLPWIAADGPAATHPLGQAALARITPFDGLAAALPGDPLAVGLLLCGLFGVVAMAGVYLALRDGVPLAGVLGSLMLFFGTGTAWLVDRVPGDAAVHLLVAALLLATLTCRGRLRLLGSGSALLALCLFSLQTAMALALAWAACRLQSRRWRLVLGLAGFVFGLVQQGASLGLLVALLLWLGHSRRSVRFLAAAGLMAPGPGLFGLAALGVALGRWLTRLWICSARVSPRLRQGELLVPRRWLVTAAAVVLIWRFLNPGETTLNRRVLVESQHQHAPLARLMVPHTLAGWIAWRGKTLGLGQQDLATAARLKGLRGPAAVLGTGSAEPRRPLLAGVVSCLAGGRPLHGWFICPQGCALLPALDAYRLTRRPEVLEGTPLDWLLVPGLAPVAIAHPTAPPAASPASLRVEPEQAVVCGRPNRLAVIQGGCSRLGYRLTRNGKPFGPRYPVELARASFFPFVLPKLPGVYGFEWYVPGTNRSLGEGGLGPFRSPSGLPLRARLTLPAVRLPAASLLPVQLKLTNLAPQPLRLPEVRGCELVLHSLDGRFIRDKPLVHPLHGLTVEARKTRRVTLFLRTPVAVDNFRLRLELLSDSGRLYPIAMHTPTRIRTWRRRLQPQLPDGVTRRSL